MPININGFLQIKPLLDKNLGSILGIECPLYSRRLKLAGRCDLVAEYNGILSIVDYKTSRKEKKTDWIESYLLQTTLYSMMLYELKNVLTKQIVIIIAGDEVNEAQVFIDKPAIWINRALECVRKYNEDCRPSN